MSTIGKTIVVSGEVRASEDLTIEGRVHGPLWCEGHVVVLAESADVAGDVVARDITVFGRVTGQLVATDVVDLRSSAEVTGDIVSRRFIMHPDARFSGRVEPQHLDAAIRVAKYHQRKRDEALAEA